MAKKRQHEELPESLPESPAPANEETIVEPEAVVTPKSAEKFEVMAEKIFSYRGQFLTLHKGDIIEPASYGPTFAAVLEDVGVELKKVAS